MALVSFVLRHLSLNSVRGRCRRVRPGDRRRLRKVSGARLTETL